MTLSRRGLLASGLLAATLPSTSDAALQDRFSPGMVAGDLAILRDAYEALHPGLTRYLPPGGFAARAAAVAAWARTPRSPGEVYLALARLTAQVRCGHSFPNPTNQARSIRQEILGRPDRVPFCAIWINGRLVVTDPLASGLPRGAVVERIDGADVEGLGRAMLPLTRADGSNDGKRRRQLDLTRGDRWAAFDVYRPLLSPVGGQGGALRIEVRAPGGGRLMREAAPLAEGARGAGVSEDPQAGWRFEIGADGVGRLTMPDWSLYRTEWDWRSFLDASVDALIDAGARGLVVDLRENEGGLDCGDVLLARLVERPVEDDGYRRLVRFRETPSMLRPYLDTWDRSFDALGADAVPEPGMPGFLNLGAAESRRIEPRGRRFTGRVAVLISETCSSATYQFAGLVQRLRAATLIGRETGGNLRGINGGAFFFVRLPETGFEVDLPLIGYYPPTPQPDQGVRPDITVRRSVADVVAGRDREMESAVALVRG